MPIPAIIVTIELPGGPTLRLDYDAARDHGRLGRQRAGAFGDVWAGTIITVREQPGVMSPRDAINAAGAYLLACAIARHPWPADLRPAPREQDCRPAVDNDGGAMEAVSH